MNGKGLIDAVAYFRTSSATNVGDDKDSESRQRDAVTRFAKRNGYAVVETFYDAAVSGADPITERPGFTAMLERIVGNGVRVILVETASRFARSVLTQEVGFGHLQGLGVTLIAVDSPESFLSQEPMMVALRQMQGVFSQLDKATLVAKLKSGRERKKRETGKGCGRKSLAELAPDAVALAKKLRRYPVNGHKRSLNEVAAELEAEGYVTRRGTRYGGAAVARMVGEGLAREARVLCRMRLERRTKGRDHSRPFRFSAWRRYQVRRDISSLSQGFLASMDLARSSIRGRRASFPAAVFSFTVFRSSSGLRFFQSSIET
jgi:DNA invertase Pin-like site-specific DNA recombinase